MGAITKNFIYNIVLNVSAILFPIITFPYISRILGPEGVGKIQFVTTFAQYFVILAALGIPVYGIREVAKRRHQATELSTFFTEMILLRFTTSSMLLVIYTALVLLVPVLYIDRSFYAIAAFILVFSFCEIDWFFSGLERFKFIAGRSVIIKLLSLVVLFAFVKDKTDDIYYLWLSVAIGVSNNLWNIWSARKYFNLRTINLQGFKKHIKPLLYIFSTIAAISIYSFLDTIILGFIKGYEEVGYYTAASKINKIMIPILTSLGAVLIPQISQAFKENNLNHVGRLARYSFDYVLLLGIPMTFGLIALAPELIMLFSGPEFLPTIVPMQIFAFVVLIIGLSNVWAIQILTPAGKDKQVTISVTIGVVVSLILNFLLIPYFSFTGAAIANVTTELVVMILFAYFASRIIKQDFNYKLIISTTIVSVSFVPIAYLIRNGLNLHELITSVVTIAVCGAVYLVAQLFVIKSEVFFKIITDIRYKLKLL